MKIHSLPDGIDLSKCILWQYENATRLQQLIQMMQDGTEMASVELWKNASRMFDLDNEIKDTDENYQYRISGLQVLSNLFGLSRPQYNGTGIFHPVSYNAWRRYLKGMIWIMDSDGSANDINKWLSIVFPTRNSYVIDNLDMTITYKFYPTITIDDEDWELVNIEGFLPAPAGVKSIVNLENNDKILGLGIEGVAGSGQDATLGRLNNSRFGEIAEAGESSL